MTAVLASTVVDARRELDSGIDALIVDIGLPDGDGWSLVASVRSSRAHARIPVVVMTGLLDSADVLNRTYEFQCEYLGKPFAPEALVAKLVSASRLVPSQHVAEEQSQSRRQGESRVI
jgi:DNA-binding response OmpR family regulator